MFAFVACSSFSSFVILFAFVWFLALALAWYVHESRWHLGVTFDEPSGNKHMAHSQIVWLCLRFHRFVERDVALALFLFLLLASVFAGVLRLPFTIVCFSMLSFAYD